MLVGDWKVADFAAADAPAGWPADVDPRQDRAAGKRRRAGSRIERRSAAGTARLARYTNTEIVVEVDAPSGGILVLNDVWHPWWRATIDGDREPRSCAPT